jgi:acetoin utilization protein AcuC
MRDEARGFCPFNDIAIATDLLACIGLPRVAIIDIDAHHGDGTQALLYDREVLKISLHQHGGRYFPGTGSVDEVGWGAGYGLSVNVPLPQHIGEDAYIDAFGGVVPAAIRAFGPDILILNFGVDGHYADRLSQLQLGTAAFRAIAATIHALAHEVCDGRLIVTGSGGYNPDVVATCWSVLVATLTGALMVPSAVCESMLGPGPSALAGQSSASLRPFREASAWPSQFEGLRDNPPHPDPAAARQGRLVGRIVTDQVLSLRLQRPT